MNLLRSISIFLAVISSSWSFQSRNNNYPLASSTTRSNNVVSVLTQARYTPLLLQGGGGKSRTLEIVNHHHRHSTVLLWQAAAKNNGESGKNKDNASPPSTPPTPSNIVSKDPILRDVSKTLQRVSFISWWTQVILTTISGVILLFARSVFVSQKVATTMKWYSPRFFLSGSGIFVAGLSILWTWGNGSRLSQRIVNPNKPTTRVKAAYMLRRAINVGVCLNLTGLLLNLLAAEEIIGSLAIKVLTSSSTTASILTAVENALQPLDILVVQANTNALVSHFASLSSTLFLTKSVSKLDPPSTEEKQR